MWPIRFRRFLMAFINITTLRTKNPTKTKRKRSATFPKGKPQSIRRKRSKPESPLPNISCYLLPAADVIMIALTNGVEFLLFAG